MNLKILLLLLIYYTIISLVFLSAGSTFAEEGFTNSVNLNASDITEGEIDTGGLFGSGVSFGRFFSLITVGVGLPDDTPSWFGLLFSAWQTLILIFSLGFVISSIWDG